MDSTKKVFTIPNVLSTLRILMIPVIVWLYCFEKNYIWALVVLILSALTDVADGYIARKYRLISDLGKILDPIADKLTQAATAICLATRFPIMWALFALMVVKEGVGFFMSYYAIRKTGYVLCANWHGKLATVFLYFFMALHMIWTDIPAKVSAATVSLCMAAMLLSAVLYAIRNLQQASGKLQPKQQDS